MARADALFRQLPQSRRRVVCAVALAFNLASGGMEEDLAVLRHEEHDQPVDEAQYLPVVVLLVQSSGAQLFPERSIGGVRQEAAAQRGNGLFNAIAQLVERARSLFKGCARPLLQPAFGGSLRLHARLVAEQPQQGEVGVDLTVHHGLQIELDIGLARETGVVAQHAQPQTVRDNTPQVLFGAV